MTYSPSAQGGARALVEDALEASREAASRSGADASSSKTRAIANVVERAADDLEQELPAAASYVRGAAEKLQSASSAIERGDIDQLMKVVSEAARSQPVAVFSAAAIIGFAVSRILKTSTDATLGSR